jgi:Protein of unknown function (DUF1319)
MAKRFEESVQKWYDTTRTANLKYLDLAEKPKTRDYLETINNNTAVIYDRLNLFTRISLKHFHEIHEENENLKNQIQKLKKLVIQQGQKIESLQQPLTKEEMRTLVVEIAQQPKLVEEQALKLTSDLEHKLVRIEKLLHDLKEYI